MQLVQDVMTKDVQMVLPSTKLTLAAQKMRDHNCGFLVVGNGAHVIGCVTDRDIVLNAVTRGLDSREKRVEDVMTQHMVSCKSSHKLTDAFRLMREQRVHRLVVLDGDGNPVGVLSLGDLAARTESRQEVYDTLKVLAQSA